MPLLPPNLPVDPRTMDALEELVRPGGLCLLTGAGMSTGSGIPDYRGPDGVRRVTPMELSEFLRSAAGRRRYWSRAAVGWRRFDAARPNDAHRQVAQLQDRGFAPDLITQNVDGLHQRAGSRGVLELHGTLDAVLCLDCGTRHTRAVVQADIERTNPGHIEAGAAAPVRPDGDVELPAALESRFTSPTCRGCGSDRLKPDVVFFGGSVPKERVERAYDAVARARALLVLGSSVTVMSSYRFVRHAVRERKPVGIVTRGLTRADADDVLKVDALVTPVLGELLQRLPLRPGEAPR